MNEDQLREEAAFADAEYLEQASTDINPKQFDKYQNPRQMWDWRQLAARLMGDIRGKLILDYGCGMGEESAYFAKLGAKVKAIDISQVGVEVAGKRAKLHGLDDLIDAQVMNCAHTKFPNDYFDIVHGLGILHHVGLSTGLQEVHRVLKPSGAAVFLEPLGDNVLIEDVKRRLHARFKDRRKLIPVTSGEENLKLVDLERECSRFGKFKIYPYRLTYRARKLLFPAFLYDWSLRLDYLALKVAPFLRRFSGAAVIHLIK